MNPMMTDEHVGMLSTVHLVILICDCAAYLFNFEENRIGN